MERWLPWILPYGHQVSIRRLLNHTSGVPDNTLEPPVRLSTLPGGRSHAWTPRELVALSADQPPMFPPGTAFSYSNTDNVLAGMIVEAATGRKLGQEPAAGEEGEAALPWQASGGPLAGPARSPGPDAGRRDDAQARQ